MLNIYHFKVHDLVVFGIFPGFCEHHHYLVSRTFHHPKKRASPQKQPLPIFPPPAPTTTHLFLSFCVCLFWTFLLNGIIQRGAFVSLSLPGWCLSCASAGSVGSVRAPGGEASLECPLSAMPTGEWGSLRLYDSGPGAPKQTALLFLNYV